MFGGSAVSILQALEGSEATVEGGTFQRTGGPALYGAASQLVVRGARISGAEYGVLMYRKGHLELRDTRISDTAVAGVALLQAAVAAPGPGLAVPVLSLGGIHLVSRVASGTTVLGVLPVVPMTIISALLMFVASSLTPSARPAPATLIRYNV